MDNHTSGPSWRLTARPFKGLLSSPAMLISVLLTLLCSIQPAKCTYETHYMMPTWIETSDHTLAGIFDPTTAATSNTVQGFELNFWMIPWSSGDGEARFLNLFNGIDMWIGESTGVQYLKTSVDTVVKSASFTKTTSKYININVKVGFDDYVLVNGWIEQTTGWTELNPDFTIEYNLTAETSAGAIFRNPASVTQDITIVSTSATPNFGVQIGEIRTYKNEPTNLWGVYMRHYNITDFTTFH